MEGKAWFLRTGWSTGLKYWPEGGISQREVSLPNLFNPTSIIMMSFCITTCMGAGVSCARTVQPKGSHMPQARVPTGQDRTMHYSSSLSQSMEGIYAQEHSGDAKFADLPCYRIEVCLEMMRLQPQLPYVTAPHPNHPCYRLYSVLVLGKGPDSPSVCPTLLSPQWPQSRKSKSCPPSRKKSLQ